MRLNGDSNRWWTDRTSKSQDNKERDGAHGQQREELIESRHEKSEIDVLIAQSSKMN